MRAKRTVCPFRCGRYTIGYQPCEACRARIRRSMRVKRERAEDSVIYSARHLPDEG